ncbi:MAG: hypothetical protein KDD33_10025 [Bdellovibrionales bacterium]|nr:hypothetical protein [Bdellovibrionales bacterium]
MIYRFQWKFLFLFLVIIVSYQNCGRLESNFAKTNDVEIEKMDEEETQGLLKSSVVEVPKHKVTQCDINIGNVNHRCLDIFLDEPLMADDKKLSDIQMIQSAIHFAKEETEANEDLLARIYFKKNSEYWLGRNSKSWSQIKIVNAKKISLIGNNTTLLCSKYNRPLLVHSSRQISVSGFRLRFNQPTFAMGKVIGKYENKSGRWLRVKINFGPKIPGTGDSFWRDIKNNKFLRTAHYATLWDDEGRMSSSIDLGMFLIGEIRVLKPRQQVVDIKMDANNSGKIASNYEKIKNGEKISFFVPEVTREWEETIEQQISDRSQDSSAVIGDRGPMIYIKNSANIGFKDIVVNDTFKTVVINQSNIGPIIFDNFNVERWRGRYLASVAGGIISRDGRSSVTIKNSLFEALQDDAINFNTEATYILSKISRKEFILTSKRDIILKKDDVLSFFDSLKGRDFGKFRIDAVEVVKVKDSLGIGFNKIFRVVLDKNISQSDFKLLRDVKANPQKPTYVFNLNNSHAESQVVNNVFRHKPRHVAIFNSPTLFAGNIAYDVATGLRLANATRFREGPITFGVKIFGNRFYDIRESSVYGYIATYNSAKKTETKIEDTLIECNSFHSISKDVLDLSNLGRHRIGRNQLVKGANVKAPSQIYKSSSSPVQGNFCQNRYGAYLAKSMP